MMLPVQLERGLAEEKNQVKLSIVLTKAVVRACAENEEVFLALLLRITGVVPFRIKLVGVFIDLGIP